MKSNNLFTLVLLIKGRHEFTYRWLTYMRKIKFNYPIIIGDGQDDDETKKMLDIINQDKNLNITYYRYNTHASYLNYYKMKHEIVSLVDSKYVMLCDNDDFVLINGLNDQINFLEQNSEYVSASGKILNFEIDHFKFVDYGKKPSLLSACNYYRIDEPLDDWNRQIHEIFTRFQPNFYNVFKTKILKIITSELVSLNFSDLVINEFYIQLRAATLGRSKILTSSFHYLRQRGTSSISKNYEFSEDILKKNMPSDVRKMANSISEILSTNYSKDEIRKNILKGFSDYLNFFLGNTTLKFRFPKLYKVKIFLINFIQNNLNFFYNNYKILKNYLILKKIVKSSNNTKDYNIKMELIEILNFLKEKNDQNINIKK